MATEKVTPMVLKVDLQCPCCYKKIKKTLCKFPQIRDQVYDEKANEVKITVVCCSPEKIRDKLCCKGGKTIISIKTIELTKEPEKKPDKPKEPEKPPKPAEKPKEPEKPPKPAEKPKEPEKPKPAETPKEPEKPPKPVEKPKGPERPKPEEPEKPKEDGKPKADGGSPPAEKPKQAPNPEPAKNPEPAAMPAAALQVMGPGPVIVHGVPSIFPYVGPGHDAYNAGPYHHGYGFPPPPPQPLYEGGYYGHGHMNRCDNYCYSEENPQTCTIM